jgi:hypothetical protein
MQITSQSTAVTAKRINLAGNFHHSSSSPTFSYGKTLPSAPQQYPISSQPKGHQQHTKSNCLLQCNDYSIHLVNSLKQRIKANTLIKRMYAWRGYQTKNTCVFSTSSNQYTFEARQSGQLIGTLTLTIDTGAGLLADTLYQTELNQFRQRDHRLCELSRLAFNSKNSSKKIFASLFHMAYIFARRINNIDDAFIEINPRHISFYKRMLGFKQIGDLRTCPRVNAPAVLLQLNLEYMKKQIITQAGQLTQNTRSIYPYFLSQNKEKEIIHSIQTKYMHTIPPTSHKPTFNHHQDYFQPG